MRCLPTSNPCPLYHSHTHKSQWPYIIIFDVCVLPISCLVDVAVKINFSNLVMYLLIKTLLMNYKFSCLLVTKSLTKKSYNIKKFFQNPLTYYIFTAVIMLLSYYMSQGISYWGRWNSINMYLLPNEHPEKLLSFTCFTMKSYNYHCPTLQAWNAFFQSWKQWAVAVCTEQKNTQVFTWMKNSEKGKLISTSHLCCR